METIIEGYSNYTITSCGEVYSLNYNNTGVKKPLKQRLNSKGRFYVNLSKGGKYRSFEVARLVAKAFVDNPNNKTDVNHLDGDKRNNNYKNLEWVTKEENIRHAVLNNLMPKGENHVMSVLTEQIVKDIRLKYKPYEYTYTMLSKEYGISRSHVIHIIKNRRWKTSLPD